MIQFVTIDKNAITFKKSNQIPIPGARTGFGRRATKLNLKASDRISIKFEINASKPKLKLVKEGRRWEKIKDKREPAKGKAAANIEI